MYFSLKIWQTSGGIKFTNFPENQLTTVSAFFYSRFCLFRVHDSWYNMYTKIPVCQVGPTTAGSAGARKQSVIELGDLSVESSRRLHRRLRSPCRREASVFADGRWVSECTQTSDAVYWLQMRPARRRLDCSPPLRRSASEEIRWGATENEEFNLLKKTNEWILNKAEVQRELLDTVKARKLANYGHTMRKQGRCLEKKIMQGTVPGARRRGRPRTAWMDNIKTWTGISVEESIRMTEDKNKWRKYVHGVANPRIEDG